MLLAEQAWSKTYISALLLDMFYSIVVQMEGFWKRILTQTFNSKARDLRNKKSDTKVYLLSKKPIKPLWKDTVLKSPWVFKVTISCLLTTTWKLASFLFACFFWQSPYWKLLQSLIVIWNNSSIHCSNCVSNYASHQLKHMVYFLFWLEMSPSKLAHNDLFQKPGAK